MSNGLHPSLLAVLLFAALLLAAKIITYTVNEITHRRRARELGCKPCFKARAGFFGLSAVLDALRAGREKRFPVFLLEQVKKDREHEGRAVLTTEMTMLGLRKFMTNDPVNVKAILATQFKDFGLGEERIDCLAPFLGHGIFSTDGKQWEKGRSLLRPQFVRDQVSDLELEEYHVQNLLRVLPPADATGWTPTFDIQDLFFRLTLDSATEFLFGESLDSQLADLKSDYGHKSDNDGALFGEAFDRATALMSTATRLASFRWVIKGKEYYKVQSQIHKFADHYVRKALQQDPQAISEKNLETSQKQRYVFLNALAAATRDPEEIRAQLLNILLAGRDTTASLLSWTILLFCQHPEIYAKLRSVILSTFGTYDQPQNLTFTDLKSCTYLQHVINESLRLYPVVPINVRCCMKDSTLPRGGGKLGEDPVYVRKGEEVIYSVHVIHRNEDLWGPDANDFVPERWVGKRTGWEYLPFNGGPRICIGQQFALTETSYVLVRLLQRFEEIRGIEIPAQGKERHNVSLTNSPADGVKVQVKFARD